MKHALTVLFGVVALAGLAQNLVPNPSFEEYKTCPNYPDQVDSSKFWSSYGNSSDFFHMCSPLSLNVSVPYNMSGYQDAADGGTGYCGIVGYAYFGPYREYIGATLISPLEKDSTYYISYKLNAGNELLCNTYINKVGVKFTSVTYSNANPAPTTNSAHVYSDTILTDTVNWIKHTGVFVADSGYTNIMLGSFFDKANTDTVMINTQNSFNYTLIDNVCVSKDSLYCDQFTGTKEAVSVKNKWSVYPNPTDGLATITNTQQRITNVEVFDVFGRPVRFDFDVQRSLLDIRHCPAGIYFIRAGEHTSKLVLSKKP